ncbi:MAG: YqgE/AlgH family protein [Alphaproteobacteria bacterium]|nr:YqgE/AlgH family protein [Alphaproteobacteria bacterium]
MGPDHIDDAGQSDDPDGHEREERVGYLTGQLLIAMPAMRDPRFTRTVIYVCAHNEEGAMGIVVNRLIGSISFQDLMEQLELDPDRIPETRVPSIHFGGPVETGRGFVLHTTDYLVPDSMQLSESLALTATVDILRDISEGAGPDRRLLALGYAGWGPGQLDNELQENAWLSVDSDPEILFDKVLDDKWDRALAKIGISPSLLSTEAGHA